MEHIGQLLLMARAGNGGGEGGGGGAPAPPPRPFFPCPVIVASIYSMANQADADRNRRHLWDKVGAGRHAAHGNVCFS